MFEYIEVFYNRIGRHSALDYANPAEFELARVAQLRVRDSGGGPAFWAGPDAMRIFPFNFIEASFIVLVEVLPLAVGFLWWNGTFGGFLGRVGISMVVGLGLWVGLILIVYRHDK